MRRVPQCSISLGSAQGSDSDMRGSMLFPSSLANIPHTAHKCQFTTWEAGSHPWGNKLITNSKYKILKKPDREILQNHLWNGLCVPGALMSLYYVSLWKRLVEAQSPLKKTFISELTWGAFLPIVDSSSVRQDAPPAHVRRWRRQLFAEPDRKHKYWIPVSPHHGL